MDASVELPGVQEYVKRCNFSKTLYMIIGVASAKKLSGSKANRAERRGADMGRPVWRHGGRGYSLNACYFQLAYNRPYVQRKYSVR